MKVRTLLEELIKNKGLVEKLCEDGVRLNKDEALAAADFIDNCTPFKVVEWIN
jgi:hypothetical protein